VILRNAIVTGMLNSLSLITIIPCHKRETKKQIMGILGIESDDVVSFVEVGVAMFNLIADAAFADYGPDDSSTYFSAWNAEQEGIRRQHQKDRNNKSDQDLGLVVVKKGGAAKNNPASKNRVRGVANDAEKRRKGSRGSQTKSTRKAAAAKLPQKKHKESSSKKPKSSKKDGGLKSEKEQSSKTKQGGKSARLDQNKSRTETIVKKSRSRSVERDQVLDERASRPVADSPANELKKSPSLDECAGIVAQRAVHWQKTCEKNTQTPSSVPTKGKQALVHIKYSNIEPKIQKWRNEQHAVRKVGGAYETTPKLSSPSSYDSFVKKFNKWHKQETTMSGHRTRH
jgi:hypothetical protein